jgi:hypothetical protein
VPRNPIVRRTIRLIHYDERFWRFIQNTDRTGFLAAVSLSY